MAENEIKKTGHSYSEVMRAIDKLPEEEKTELLEFLKLNEITYLMDNAESVTAYCNDLIMCALVKRQLRVALLCFMPLAPRIIL